MTNSKAKVPSIAKASNSIAKATSASATNSTAKPMNLTAKAPNSTANGTKSTAKVTNSIAKTCNSKCGIVTTLKFCSGYNICLTQLFISCRFGIQSLQSVQIHSSHRLVQRWTSPSILFTCCPSSQTSSLCVTRVTPYPS